jgi:serine/threonine protein kinase
MGTNQSQPVPSQSSKKKRPFYDSCLSNELEPDKKRADREDAMIPDPTKLLNERMNRILSPINPQQLCVACLNKFPFYDYRFLKKVGEGKFTVVYKGIIMNDESAPKVAIRETSVDLMDAAKYEDLKFELNILSQMKYPNFPDLIAIYEPPMFNAKFYSVTEYIRGGEMVSALASHETYTFLDLLFYFQQILSAIHYLHHRGVVHNNLVPENIVFDRKYNPKKRADNRIKIVGFDRLDTVVAAFPKRPIQKPWTDNYFYPPEVGNGTFMDPRFSMAFHRTEKVDEAVLKQAMDIWLFGELFFFLIGGYFLRKLPYNPVNPSLPFAVSS